MPPQKEEMRSSTPALEDPGATRKALEQWFRDTHPEAREVRLGELEIPQATGMSNITVSFRLRWREGDAGKQRQMHCVARLKPRRSVFPEYDLRHQYRIMESLAGEAKVPVPSLLGEDPRGALLGTPFFVMAHVDGLIPTDIPPYHMGGWLHDDATPQQRGALWRLGVEKMAAIHRLEYRRLGLDFLSPPARLSPLEQQLRYWEKFLHWSLDGAPHPLGEQALARLRRDAPKDEPIALCWGDARMGNIIFGRQLSQPKVAALLDWEMARLGNPVQDLAWWHFLDDSFWRGLNLPRLEGLPPPAEDLVQWEKHSGHSVRHYQYYYLLAAFKHTLIMSRIMFLQQQQDQILDHFVAQLLRDVLAESR